MWEVFHETVPFDGDLKACTEYVINSESRPKISEEGRKHSEADSEYPGHENRHTISEQLASLIRECWQTHPADRPKMGDVC